MRRTLATTLALAAALIAAPCHAQNALDANLRVGSGGLNPAAGHAPMNYDIYRINRETGAFEYDENAAFATPRYQPMVRDHATVAPRANPYYHPVLTTGPDAGIFTVDRRTGTFRYNEANALESTGYTARRSPPPAPPPPTKTIDVGQTTPVYRAARTTPRATPLPLTRLDAPGTTPRSDPAEPPALSLNDPHPRGPGNLRANRYRPPLPPPSDLN